MNDLAKEISIALEDFKSEVIEDIHKVVEEVASETVEELKQNSPKRTGKYAKKWKAKTEYKGPNGERIVIYNGSLTHLLEYGHETKNGGRTKSYSHIAPAEQHAIQKTIQRLRERLSK